MRVLDVKLKSLLTAVLLVAEKLNFKKELDKQKKKEKKRKRKRKPNKQTNQKKKKWQ